MDYPNSQRNGARSPRAARGQEISTMRREAEPYSRVRGNDRYTHVAEGRKRKKSVAKIVVLAIVAAIVVAVAVAAISARNFYTSIGQKLNENVSEETKAVLADQQSTAQELTSNWTDMSPFYMLLLGVDASAGRLYGDEANSGYGENGAYRADTIILARVDPGNKKLTLVSIHRDTWYPIDGVYGKINAAYAYGGIPKTIQVISEFAGVPIIHFAEVDIDCFMAIVDTLGGIEIDVPYEIVDEQLGGYLPAGLQTLDGDSALLFVRSRHAYDDLGDGDRYRAAHQRLFISAVIEKLLSSDPITMVNAISTVAEYVTTDFTIDEIVNLALAFRGMNFDTDIYSTMNPTTATYENSTWYEISQDEYWAEIMRQVDAGEKPDIDTAYRSVTDDINNADYGTPDLTAADVTVAVKNASGDADRYAQVITALQAAGYIVVDAGEANLYLEQTTVVWEQGRTADLAQNIADLLGGTTEAAGDTWLVTGDIMVVVGTY